MSIMRIRTYYRGNSVNQSHGKINLNQLACIDSGTRPWFKQPVPIGIFFGFKLGKRDNTIETHNCILATQ